MSSDRNSTNYQQKQTYNTIGTNELITSSGDVKHDDVQSELDSYRVTTTSASMPHTKTMILQSASGEFHYINQPPSITAHDYDSPGGIIDEVSESGDGYDATVNTNTVKEERNGQPVVLLDSGGTIAGRFSVGLSSLPPPPPPSMSIVNHNLNHRQHQSIIVGRPTSSSSPATSFYGRLSFKDDILCISDHKTEIGRNSSTSTVDFHVGKNSFVSRKHLRLIHDHDNNAFYLMCLSKNGVFVNDVFQRKSSEPLKLPKTWVHSFLLYTPLLFFLIRRYLILYFLISRIAAVHFVFQVQIFGYCLRATSTIRWSHQRKKIKQWKTRMWYMHHWKYRYQNMTKRAHSHHQRAQSVQQTVVRPVHGTTIPIIIIWQHRTPIHPIIIITTIICRVPVPLQITAAATILNT